MADALFWLVAGVIVAMAAAAPVANQETEFISAAYSPREGDMKVVAKRAEEMMFFGNQQNEARVPMKKSDPSLTAPVSDSELSPPKGQVDQGSDMSAHEQVPVEEDLNSRADAVRGASDEEKMKEGLKEAVGEVKEAIEGGEEDGGEEEGNDTEDVSKDDSIVNAVDETPADVADDDNEDNDKADEEEDDDDDDEVADIPETEDNENDDNVETDDNSEDLSEEPSSPSSSSSSSEDVEENKADNDDESDVEELLQELSQESDDGNDVATDNGSSDDESDDNGDEETSNVIKEFQQQAMVPDAQAEPEVVDPNYYQTMYHILTNSYRGGPADNYYNYNYMPPYIRRRRRSPLRHRHSLNSIRHTGRFKRDLPSDWLSLYRNLDLPTGQDEDALLADQDDSYGSTDDDLSRYIYGNLLNRLLNSYQEPEEPDVIEESPYGDLVTYDPEADAEDSLLEQYQPEDPLYEPYEDNQFQPEYQYRKRGGSEYSTDSRRKRYFYPAFQEPETHWGAFVPEKRDYSDSIERLQRLALALGDNMRTYYENMLREYRK